MQKPTSWRMIAAAGAMLVAFALPAKAVTTLTLNDGVTPVTVGGATFGDSGVIGSISDFFSFSLSGPTNFATTASVTNSAGDIGSLAIAILSGQGLGGAVLSGPSSAVLVGSSLVASTAISLAAGTYSIRVTGTGAAGGSAFGGSLDVSPAAVPIPGALFLFGSGLIGLGALTMRKKRPLKLA